MWSRSFEAIDLQKTSAVCALEPLWNVHKRRPIGVGDQAQLLTVGSQLNAFQPCCRLALAYCVMWISSSLLTWPRK